MKPPSLLLAALLPLLLPSLRAQSEPQLPVPPPAGPGHSHPDASASTEKHDKGQFLKKHESFLARAKAGPIGLLFLGDSITDNWRARAPRLFDEAYGKYQPANFGIGGDTTQNVIWRIDHGELDGIHPKVVVLMLGTNNSASNSAEEIFAADRKLVGLIREKIPQAKVLLLAIFPRGPRQNTNGTPDDSALRMGVIARTNRMLATLDDGRNVRFLDIGAKFLGPDGRIPDAIMADHLHPTLAGYRIWVEAMQPTLDEMMR
ncbi:MAG TPA: GDSL-type esterase/lipase family protein [Opitutaceae bacterium]|nr:GDSL-type esterase/lipase family protein [Opitutaceae bacterium]